MSLQGDLARDLVGMLKEKDAQLQSKDALLQSKDALLQSYFAELLKLEQTKAAVAVEFLKTVRCNPVSWLVLMRVSGFLTALFSCRARAVRWSCRRPF